MRKLVVATTQQQMRLFDSVESYRKELSRFMHMAHIKGAELVVLPALSGALAASHLVQGFQARLLRQAEERRRAGQSLWARARSSLAGSTASLIGATYRHAYVEMLHAEPQAVAELYEELFSGLARSYEVTLVAGSAYLPEAPGSGLLRHRVTVFGPDGQPLGRHDKLTLSVEDEGLAEPGDVWHVISTPVGRVGILLGEEALYPEAGRVLAYEGADILVTLAAASDPALAAHIRQATLAQAQANRIFALTSFLIGKNHLAHEEGSGALFTGKSGIYAPLEMTPRYTGVLVEMGTDDTEGLVTAELDQVTLGKWWEGGPEPVRKKMPVELFASYLPSLYSSRRTLADVWPQPGMTSESMVPAVAPVVETTVAATEDEAIEEPVEDGAAEGEIPREPAGEVAEATAASPDAETPVVEDEADAPTESTSVSPG
jgi:predicted amidohydrolase